jgi:hypothetical protein
MEIYGAVVSMVRFQTVDCEVLFEGSEAVTYQLYAPSVKEDVGKSFI